MPISVTVDAKAALSAFSVFAAGMSDTSTANRQLSVQLYSWTIRNYDACGALQDEPWKALTPRTIAEKLRLGYSPEPLAPRSGNLRQSFAGFADRDQAGVGARASYGVDYAEVHEKGTAKIPQRRMLPQAKVGLDYATRIYGLHFEQAKDKAGL